MKTLGIDIAAGSLGWAIVERDDTSGLCKLGEHGIIAFPDGLVHDRSGDRPANEDRLRARASRRRYERRRLRKQMLLAVLVDHGLCPLDRAGLLRWRKEDRYPDAPAFLAWLRLPPYHLRAAALDRMLTPHELGRVLYHMAQRRGFRSNRSKGEGPLLRFNAGDLDRGIKGYGDTAELLAAHGTLGRAAVFLAEQRLVEPILRRAVKRADLVRELDLIWRRQHELGAKWADGLRDQVGDPFDGIIFFQRPDRSRGRAAGKCRFEPGKPRAPRASFMAEVFGVLRDLNEIHNEGRPLPRHLRDRVIEELFLDRDRFTLGELTEALVAWGIEGVVSWRGSVDAGRRINGAPLIRCMAHLFGRRSGRARIARALFDDPEIRDWNDRLSVIRNAEHFDEISELKAMGRDIGRKTDLKMIAATRWGFSDPQLNELRRLEWPQGHAEFSHCAMRKMIPWLRRGKPFAVAAVMANMGTVLAGRKADLNPTQYEALERGVEDLFLRTGDENDRNEQLNSLIAEWRLHAVSGADGRAFWTPARQVRLLKDRERALTRWPGHEPDPETVNTSAAEIRAFFQAHVERHGGDVPFIRMTRAEDRVRNYLIAVWQVDVRIAARTYSVTDPPKYKIRNVAEGILGSPFHPGLRSPVLLRSMHVLRRLVNELVRRGLITMTNGRRGTRVRICLARELVRPKDRKGLDRHAEVLEKKREEAIRACHHWFSEHRPGAPITEDAVDRMRLYLESMDLFGQARCIYTGRRITLDEVFGPDVLVDRIWPVHLALDTGPSNLVLCDARFVTRVKRDRIPSDLPNWTVSIEMDGVTCPAVMANADLYRARMEHFYMLARKRLRERSVDHGPGSDQTKVEAVLFQETARYWKEKYERFARSAVASGHVHRAMMERRSAGPDHVRSFLRTGFGDVDLINARFIDFLRFHWFGPGSGMKSRDDHFHHLQDAMILAAADRSIVESLLHGLSSKDEHREPGTSGLPWRTFLEDVFRARERVLVHHLTLGAVGRQSRYRRHAHGRSVIATGHTVRGPLHKDTFFGRIDWADPGTGEHLLRTVLRKRIALMTPSDVDAIVDPELREQMRTAGLAQLQKQGGLPVEVRNGRSTRIHVVKKLRVFTQDLRRDSKGGLLPEDAHVFGIKLHRDRVAGREHRHQLLATHAENTLLGIYANARGDVFGHIVDLFEVTRSLGQEKQALELHRLFPMQLERELRGRTTVYELQVRNGRPVVLRRGQMVLLYHVDPSEVALDDPKDLSARLHRVHGFERDGRLSLVHHLEARSANQLQRTSLYVPGRKGVRIRVMVSHFNALVEGVDMTGNLLGELNVDIDRPTDPEQQVQFAEAEHRK